MEAHQVTRDYIELKIEDLPTLPTIVHELNEVINDPMSSTADVEKIMANDQSLTTKVLKLANSAYYAIPGGVTSLSRAIAYLGFDTVNQLVLTATIFEALSVKGPTKFDMNEFWKHSLGVGIASETIAKKINYPTPSDLFTCGLIHDMGKVALYALEADLMNSIVLLANEKAITYLEAESELKILSHTEIGCILAEKWNLPALMQASIKYHHQKSPNARGGISSELNKVVDIIFAGNLLLHALKFGDSGHKKVLGAPKEVMERLTLADPELFKALIVDIKENLERANDFLKVLEG